MKQIPNNEIYTTESKQVFRRKLQSNEFEPKITTRRKLDGILKSPYTVWYLKYFLGKSYKLSSLPEGYSPVSIVSYRNQGEFVALDQVQHSSLRSF